MSLIATARAIDDPRFRWRVNAAALVTATTKVNDPDGPEQWFAEYVLDNPMVPNATLLGLVAANQVIAATVTVDAFNTVNTEDVPDSDILYVVGEQWAKVATRHDEQANSVAVPANTV